jgi:hypothetical protein
MASMKIEAFNINVHQSEIDALRTRIANTCWAPELDNENWSYRVNGSYLRERHQAGNHCADCRGCYAQGLDVQVPLVRGCA